MIDLLTLRMDHCVCMNRSCTSNSALILKVITGLVRFNDLDYVLRRWHTTLLLWAISIFIFISQPMVQKLLNLIQAMLAFYHVVLFFASIIVLVLLAQHSIATYVLTKLTNDISEWTNPAAA